MFLTFCKETFTFAASAGTVGGLHNKYNLFSDQFSQPFRPSSVQWSLSPCRKGEIEIDIDKMALYIEDPIISLYAGSYKIC